MPITFTKSASFTPDKRCDTSAAIMFFSCLLIVTLVLRKRFPKRSNVRCHCWLVQQCLHGDPHGWAHRATNGNALNVLTLHRMRLQGEYEMDEGLDIVFQLGG